MALSSLFFSPMFSSNKIGNSSVQQGGKDFRHHLDIYKKKKEKKSWLNSYTVEYFFKKNTNPPSQR